MPLSISGTFCLSISNLGRTSHRFRDMASFSLRSAKNGAAARRSITLTLLLSRAYYRQSG